MFENKIAPHYKNIIFVSMALLVIFFIVKIVDVAIMFFGAFIISASVLPIINKMKKYMPRSLAVAIVLFLILFGVLLVFVPLATFAVEQTASLFKNFNVHVENFNTFLNMPILGHTMNEVFNIINFDNIGNQISSLAGNILSKGFSAGKIILGLITTALMVAIMVFYLCSDEEHLKGAYLSFFPAKFKNKASEILDILTVKVGGYVLAQILSMIGVGIMTLIGLLIIGHNDALLISFITFILDLIPVIGATFAVIFGVITAYDGGIGFMFLTLGVMLIAQWLQNQILRPVLFGKFMNIHPLLIIVSILIGAKFLGFTGAILGPAFASLVCVLVNELYIKPINDDGK